MLFEKTLNYFYIYPACCFNIRLILNFFIILYSSTSTVKSKSSSLDVLLRIELCSILNSRIKDKNYVFILDVEFTPSLEYPHLSVSIIFFIETNKYLSYKQPLFR